VRESRQLQGVTAPRCCCCRSEAAAAAGHTRRLLRLWPAAPANFVGHGARRGVIEEVVSQRAGTLLLPKPKRAPPQRGAIGSFPRLLGPRRCNATPPIARGRATRAIAFRGSERAGRLRWPSPRRPSDRADRRRPTTSQRRIQSPAAVAVDLPLCDAEGGGAGRRRTLPAWAEPSAASATAPCYPHGVSLSSQRQLRAPLRGWGGRELATVTPCFLRDQAGSESMQKPSSAGPTCAPILTAAATFAGWISHGGVAGLSQRRLPALIDDG
jgi:hypothetical protein